MYNDNQYVLMTITIRGPNDWLSVIPVYAWIGYGVVVPNAITTNGSAKMVALWLNKTANEIPKIKGWSCEIIPGEISDINVEDVDSLTTQLWNAYNTLSEKYAQNQAS